jgi:WD40 repeat protein
VSLSEEGKAWLLGRQLPDESRGLGGFISRLSLDGSACRVVWQASIGGEKDGVLHPDGWESPITWAIGRQDNYFLQVHDERPRQHGELMLFCHAGRAVAGEQLPLEPHRYMLYTGSDDECVRVWDLYSHTPVAEMSGEHENKVSSLAFNNADRLISASQDRTIKVW